MAIDPETGMARYLAEQIGRIRNTQLSDEVRTMARQHMLDAIASAFIGCRNPVFVNLVKLSPKVKKGCAWPGSGPDRTDPVDAGAIWAFAINASVFEDGSRQGACHPAPAVISPVIAFSGGKNWGLIDRAIVAGYDVMVRLARSGNPQLTLKGFHPTAVTAPFGAAAVLSVLLEHDVSKTQNAICLAALGGAGLMAAFKSGSTQPLQVAWAVRNGIGATLMAGAGHKGYARIIEEGFFPAYLGHEPDPPVDHPFDQGFAIQGSYMKPYPGCRHLHPSIDALAKILEANQIRLEQIEEIRVGTYKTAMETEIHSLNSRGDAYFNIPYALAARAVLGRNDWDAFDEKHFSNDKIESLMKKVTVHVDPEVENLFPNQRGAVVEVRKVDGEPLREKVTQPLGEPENPLPLSATREKFHRETAGALSKTDLEKIESLLNISGPSETAESLFEILAGS